MPNLNETYERDTLKRLVESFCHKIKRRQDSRLAKDLNEDLLSGHEPGYLRPSMVRRLAKWCKTAGIYADAMIVARDISLLLFGEVLDRDLLGV